MRSQGFKNKKILITGGSGFIGSHLVKRLRKEGARVYVVDNAVKKQSRYAYPIDITDFQAIYSLIHKEQIEYIFHLAAVSEVGQAYTDPVKNYMTNVMGTIYTLESARHSSSIRGIIVASSDKAYGKTENNKYLESDPLCGSHPYEVAKGTADQIARSYNAMYGLPVAVTRFGNVYGEGDLHFSRLVPGVMRACVKNVPFIIRSDGTLVRDYIYVADVVEGYMQIAQQIHKCKGEAFNFGSNDTLSVIDVIHTIEHALHKKIAYRITDTAHAEIPYQSLDWSRAAKVLSWRPQNVLKTTIPGIFEWYRNYFRQLQ